LLFIPDEFGLNEETPKNLSDLVKYHVQNLSNKLLY